jgi:hypothetical protein
VQRRQEGWRRSRCTARKRGGKEHCRKTARGDSCSPYLRVGEVTMCNNRWACCLEDCGSLVTRHDGNKKMLGGWGEGSDLAKYDYKE